MKIVSNLSNKPESSVLKASGTRAETKATYDWSKMCEIQKSRSPLSKLIERGRNQ